MRSVFRLFFFLIFFSFFLFSPAQIFASETQPQFAVIINQVRGNECCSAGGTNELSQQLVSLQKLQLPATFAIRYDTLKNPKYTQLLKQAKSPIEIAAFLEITPQFAQDSGVLYTGTKEQWYEAEHAFAVGYQPADRIKLIDQYMLEFKNVFGSYPTTTVAWMIDPQSLQYLADKYHVTAHEITREQWGTDSYTLYGGPVHYPYFPSKNWALIPDSSNTTSPLILRQTIADAVWNYGDPTSSFTSQPNDYRRRERGFDYFTQLFTESQNQPTEKYTFSLLGLENSMPSLDQTEFNKQLEFVSNWSKSGSGRKVVTAQDFASWLKSSGSLTKVESYSGSGGEAGTAWTITTNVYQVRLRYDQKKFYISDLRLYSPLFKDPYFDQTALRHGHWIVPFLVDGSRFRLDSPAENILTSVPDNLTDRRAEDGTPSRIELPTDQVPKLVKNGDEYQFVSSEDNSKIIAKFTADALFFSSTLASKFSAEELKKVVTVQSDESLVWKSRNGQVLWQLKADSDSNKPFIKYTPQVSQNDLSEARVDQYPYLFPELKPRPLDTHNTNLYVNNQFAIAGRNPVRFVFFPRDEFGYPIAIEGQPTATASPEVSIITQEKPHDSNGMIFIDFTNNKPGEYQTEVDYGAFHSSQKIYFAPNCKNEKGYCLTHPVQAWWFFRNWLQDKVRSKEEQQQNQWLK